MFDTQGIKNSFSRAAPRYDAQAHLQARVRAQCMALARPLWDAGAHILDTGCGTGAFNEPQWHITGLDIAFGMCALAGRHMPAVNASAEAMPFAGGCFDGVFSSLMLQWASEPAAVLREWVRVMKPGASCVAATLVEGTLQELRDCFSAIDDAPHVSDFANAPALLDCAAQAGLLVREQRQDAVIEHYPDATALMRSLKSIGASNKQAMRRRGMTTPRQWQRLQNTYRQRFGDAQGIRATWQVLYMVLEKPR